jgi:5-methylcytosine-specific restriction endonuclease McrA
MRMGASLTGVMGGVCMSDRHVCNRWCRIHWYYDFETGMQESLPREFYFMTGPPVNGHNQWGKAWVVVGPPAYYPKKPTAEQWEDIRRVCPHDPPQLTCNYCRRHEFRALPI